MVFAGRSAAAFSILWTTLWTIEVFHGDGAGGAKRHFQSRTSQSVWPSPADREARAAAARGEIERQRQHKIVLPVRERQLRRHCSQKPAALSAKATPTSHLLSLQSITRRLERRHRRDNTQKTGAYRYHHLVKGYFGQFVKTPIHNSA